MEDLYEHHIEMKNFSADGAVADCLDLLDNVPTADVVEVVRCHECKHYKPQEKSKHWLTKKNFCCRSAILKVTDFDFCSYGERSDT